MRGDCTGIKKGVNDLRDKFYRVGFVTKKGALKHWDFDINADTAKQAKDIAKERWVEESFGHMFQIDVERIDPDSVVHCGHFRMIY